MPRRDRSIGVQVSGGATLRRTLREAGVDLADLKAAHAEVAELARKRAADLAPIGDGRTGRPGRLRDSIKGRGNRTSAVIRAGTPTRVRYAGPINYGWPARHIVAARFLNRAVEEHENEYLAHYLAALEKITSHVRGVPGP